MARQKRTSKVVENAEIRIAALKSINESLTLGGDLSIEAYSKLAVEIRSMLDKYNSMLSDTDAFANRIKQKEKEVGVFGVRMLAGVAAQYGKDSDEYEKAGGVRTSERKRPVKNPKPS